MGDYNNDGWEDLFITYYGQNQLYRNNGDGTSLMSPRRPACCIPRRASAAACTFVDYNRDGLLDLFVADYLEIDWLCAQAIALF